MQSRVAEYSEALRREFAQNFLWSVEFALHPFARKFARRGEVYLTASTIPAASMRWSGCCLLSIVGIS